MVPGNFNWFLHSMLYYHTKHVLRKQALKEERKEKSREDDSSDSNDSDEDEDEDLNSVD